MAYFLLNFALFLPLYLLSTDGSSFWPTLQFHSSQIGDTQRFISQVLFKQLAQYRNNFDIFRLNVEWAVLVALWVLVAPWLHGRLRLLRGLGIILCILYLLGFYYYLYEAITVSFFLVDPIFYNQYFMAIDGLQFLMSHIDLSLFTYVGAGVAVILVHFFIWWLLRILFRSEMASLRFHWSIRVGTLILAALAIASVVRFKVALANPVMVASSLSYKLEKNITESLEIAHNVANYNEELVNRSYDYQGYTLLEKPNIYLIFVESYGSVLYKRPHFRPDYLRLLKELDEELAAHDWHSVSNFSTSTTWGGGSWMAYNSFLFGLRIDVHPQFLYLRNRYRYATYPDLGHYLKSQGYRYFRASSLSVEMTDSEWAQYIHYYGVDEWLRYRDLAYTGERYSWGPSPPDQYTLGFLHERMLESAPNQPHLAFLITQNSHYPWRPLPQVIDDWHNFNQGSFPSPNAAKGLTGLDAQRANYLAAIKNQLSVMVHFITHVLSQQDENAIVVLVGDHQPPRVARRDDGFETPIHIIGRDPALVQTLAVFGFQPGLTVNDQANPIKHEGFYSMFMQLLIGLYGEEGVVPPPYKPNGVNIKVSH
ncbi:MAG: sulfatase-like hydrolase/transferase [Chloroflexota bacterium]